MLKAVKGAQMVLGSPEKMGDTLGSSMLLAIRSARRSIHISHAYFLPCREFTKALVEAMHRGVHVEIMVPGPHTDALACAAPRSGHCAG